MGMHFGVLAAHCTWDELFSSLKEVTGEFRDIGPVPKIEDFDLDPRDDGFPVVGGDWDGSTFLLDSSMMLSAHGYDRLVGLSRDLDTTITACLGETVSGTYSFLLASSGVLRRLYYHCISGIYEPFQVGEPLPSESSAPLNDIDGNGFFRAFSDQGLNFFPWYESGPKHAYLYTLPELDEAPKPRTGTLDTQFDAHCQTHGVPNNAKFKTRVVRRTLPDGSVGFDILPVPPKRGLLHRLFARR